MTPTSDSATVRLSGDVVAEIESVWTGTDLDSFVDQAVQAYVAALLRRKLQEQLARDYDELATFYPELAAELADEVWLSAENEALLRTEHDAGRKLEHV